MIPSNNLAVQVQVNEYCLPKDYKILITNAQNLSLPLNESIEPPLLSLSLYSGAHRPKTKTFYSGLSNPYLIEMPSLQLLKEIKLLPRAKFTKPKKEDGETRPRCGVKKCNRVLYKITHDTGYQGPKKYEQGRKPLQRTKRGRPRHPENKRIQPIGWWCPHCELFYYQSGDILPDTMIVIVRLS